MLLNVNYVIAGGDSGEEYDIRWDWLKKQKTCLGAGSDSLPLRRDCGTDAGFVHLSCLVDYATRKSERWDGTWHAFSTPWTVCPYCHQRYENELRIYMAAELLSFVKENYPAKFVAT